MNDILIALDFYVPLENDPEEIKMLNHLKKNFNKYVIKYLYFINQTVDFYYDLNTCGEDGEE